MRETLRGALLSALLFGGLALLAAPATAQGGGGTMECGEENGSVECDDEITVTDTPLPPDPDPPPPPPPVNCLGCHPDPHRPPQKKKSCSAEIQVLNAASDLEDRECRGSFFGLTTQECRDARAAYDLALKALSICRGPTIGPGR